MLIKSVELAFYLSFCLSLVSLVLSGEILFRSPSNTASNYIIEVNFTGTDFNAIYNPRPYRELDITDTRLDPLYRFGLWGFCSGKLVDGEFVINKCSGSRERYEINIGYLLASSYISRQNAVSSVKPGLVFDMSYYKSTGFNGIFSGFILSITEFFLMQLILILHLFGSKILLCLLIPAFCINIATIISLIIGITVSTSVYSNLNNYILQNYSSLGITSTFTVNLTVIGWVTVGLDVLVLLVLLYLIFAPFFIKNQYTKNFGEDCESYDSYKSYEMDEFKEVEK